MTVSFALPRRYRTVALLTVALLLGFFWLPGKALADPGDPPEVEAQRLVHILGYVAADYGGAVANGAIKSDSEYEEQIALLSDAATIAARLAPSVPSGPQAPDLPAAVAGVRALVDAKASEERLGLTVAEVRATVIGAFHLSEAPTSPPSASHGQELYAANCATCHGDTGRADTARAASLNPHPANFHDPVIADPLSPMRVAGTVRFGVNGTSMIPFTFLSDADRWDLAFFVMGLRHEAPPATDSPAYTLSELSVRTDAQLLDELRAAGVAPDKLDAVLADLRRRAPYETRAASSALGLARVKLDRARVAIDRGETNLARTNLLDAYLEGIEPEEGAIRTVDPGLVSTIEERFLALRGRLEAGAPPAELDAAVETLLSDVTRAETLLAVPASSRSFVSTAVASGGILLREGSEAALLIAALLSIAAQAGIGDKKRFVHLGWTSALALGLLTWFASARLIAISGASRELIEGATALLATGVLFYVSYSLVANKGVARWMKFLRHQVTPRRAAASLFGVAFLAAYREAFETVLFYQALLASSTSSASMTAALVGAVTGAALLAMLVLVYSRAGRFAPPKMFYRVSSYLLYALAVVFAGQGVAALQATGVLPFHPIRVPSVPALGLHPTLETCAAQGLLLSLALFALFVNRNRGPKPTATDRMVHERAA